MGPKSEIMFFGHVKDVAWPPPTEAEVLPAAKLNPSGRLMKGGVICIEITKKMTWHL